MKHIKHNKTAKVYFFWCWGCDEVHQFNETWSVDEDTETVSPSILVTSRSKNDYRCHSFIRNAKIEYLSDCSHVCAGKTMNLAPIKSWEEKL